MYLQKEKPLTTAANLPAGTNILLSHSDNISNSEITEISADCARLFGYYRHQLKGEKFSKLLIPSINNKSISKIEERLLEEGGYSDFLLCRNRSRVPLKIGWLFVRSASDSSCRAKILEIIRHGRRWSLDYYLEQYDFLTGLPDRELIFKHLVEQMQEAKKYGSGLVIAIFEIDDLEHFNRGEGMAKGDMLLRDLTRKMFVSLPRSALLGRLSGDRFILILPGSKTDKRAETLFRSIYRDLANPVKTDDFIHNLSVSAGVAEYSADCLEPYDLLDKAEVALRWVKNEGGNTYRFYFKKMEKRENWIR